MGTILIYGAAFLLSAGITLATLHPVASILVFLIGEEDCIGTESINGCNSWPLAVIISLALFSLFLNKLGAWALLLTPVGPAFMALTVAANLRLAATGRRGTEFAVKDGEIIHSKTGKQLFPDSFEDDSPYYCTGPASGYCLYEVRLKKAGEVIATNNYVSEDPCGRIKKRLSELGVRHHVIPLPDDD